MIEAVHSINGTQIMPVNGDDIGFKLSFDGEEGYIQNEINVDSIILATKAKEIVLDHIATNGVFQGIPYTIQIGDVTLDYYVDLTQTPKISGDSDSTVEVKVKKRKSFEWFKKNADVLSWEAINRTNTIDTVQTKYLIVRDNQGMIILTASMATYSLAITIAEQVKSLAEAIGDLTAAIIPNTGVGLGVVVVVKPAEIAWAIAKAVIQVAFLLLSIVAFINMLKQIVQIIYPRIRELKSVTVYELITTGCEKLGFTFQSSIITSSSPLTILPVPIVNTNTKDWFLETLLPPTQPGYTKGYPTDKDTIPTLGSLIDAMVTRYNGKIWVENGVVKFERRDFLQNISSRSIRNTLNLQDARENAFTYNFGDVWKRYYLHSQVDFSDSHTTSISSGTKTEYSTEPTNVIADDLVNISGLVDGSIPFAFGTRKSSLSPAEEFWKGVCVAVDNVAGIFGASSDLASKVSARIGVMQISQPLYSVTKLLYQVGSKQPANYKDYLSADFLYQNYHRINEVDVNFKRIYVAQIPFSSQDFDALQNNNYIYDNDGTLLEILNFSWINKTKTAEIEYSIPAKYSTNTTTIEING